MPSPTRLAKWLFVLCMIALGGPSSFAQDPPAKSSEESQEDKTSEEAAPAVQAAPDAQPEPARPEEPADPLLDRTYKRAMVIDVEGPIFGSLKAYMNNRIESAKRAQVDVIIFRVHSPGGSLDDSIELCRTIGNIDWATTIAYVPQEAYSGAAIMVLGCDRIFMHPRAVLGDAGPIQLEGDAFRFVEQKRVSAIATVVGVLAAAKKRPSALAEAMVDRKLTVFEAKDKQTGGRSYLTSQQIALKEFTDQYDIGPAIPETGLDRFLTVSGTRAAELTMAEGIFDSEQAVMERLKFDNLRQTKRTWVDGTVYFLNRPFVTGLLLLLGLVGLYLELTVPGISIAGLMSLVCFGLFFWSHALGGTSGWLEVMLFALGVSLLAMEIFVLPGVGLFGITGVVMVVLSLIMASQDFVFPQTAVQWTTLRNNLLMVLGALATVVIALIIQITYFEWIPGLGRLRLEAPDASLGSGAGSLAIDNNTPELPNVGAQGLAESVLRPAGKVRFEGQLIDVVTEGDFLDPGTQVEVVKREGNRIIVRRT